MYKGTLANNIINANWNYVITDVANYLIKKNNLNIERLEY